MSPGHLVGSSRSVELFGIRLVGVSIATGKKLLFSAVLLAALYAIRWAVSRAAGRLRNRRSRFWTRQVLNILTLVVAAIGLLSIWMETPAHFGTAGALLTAGLAFALQKVVTSFAGYLLILRGKIFDVGDRITMGGVRGDVIRLGFLQTRIMEMGQPPTGDDAPNNWVHSRQYTGRIVVVSNDKVFDEPIYNYTHDFPFIWEEMRIPIGYDADRAHAERILLDAARKHTVDVERIGEEMLRDFERRYFTRREQIAPRVYYRLTDNWLELAVRFIAEAHGVRELKDAMSRDILSAFDAAGISVASSTYDIVGVPPLTIRSEPAPSEARDEPREHMH